MLLHTLVHIYILLLSVQLGNDRCQVLFTPWQNIITYHYIIITYHHRGLTASQYCPAIFCQIRFGAAHQIQYRNTQIHE
jgi:hypothetical protein